MLAWLTTAAMVCLAAIVAPRVLLSPILQFTLGLTGAALAFSPPSVVASTVAPVAGTIVVFLAGNEVDIGLLRRRWRPTFAISAASFVVTLVCTAAIANLAAGWSLAASAIAGIALAAPSTSFAYVLLARAQLAGSRHAARVVMPTTVSVLLTTSLVALLFADFTSWLAALIASAALVVVGMPRLVRRIRRGGRRSRPYECALLVAVFAALVWIGHRAGVDSAWVALIAGASMSSSGLGARAHDGPSPMWSALPLLTAVFYVTVGMQIPLRSVGASLALIAALATAKLVAFNTAVWASGRAVRWEERAVDGLLMSCGLTLPMLTASFALNASILGPAQFGVIVVAVAAAAVVAALLAVPRLGRLSALPEHLHAAQPAPAPRAAQLENATPDLIRP